MARPRYRRAFWPPRVPRDQRTDAADRTMTRGELLRHVAEIKRDLAENERSASTADDRPS